MKDILMDFNASQEQVKRFEKIESCANNIRKNLHHIKEIKEGKVHFRPTNSGITMVGLLSDRPQRGKGEYSIKKLITNFHSEFEKYCKNILHGRVTPEKKLQSFIISHAYKNDRQFDSLYRDENNTYNLGNLYFITDELPIYTENGKIVCDILALEIKNDRFKPIIIELKSSRQMARLVEQLRNYKSEFSKFKIQFESLFSAVMGMTINFTEEPEKWLVWPSLNNNFESDPKENTLNNKGIRVIQYTENEDLLFRFHFGKCPTKA